MMDGNYKEEAGISLNDMEYLPVTKGVRESMRVQKTEYIRQQMRRRQENEDALMAQLLEEQRIIDGLQRKINENLEQTEASSKYNKEFKESMNAQIYALHGISEDKLEGMREYKNAYYQGSAFSLFLLSAAMILLCGILHGFQSEICVFMLAYAGIEGALLAQEKKRFKIVDWLCKLLYLMMFPVMMVMFVCFELGYPEYEQFLPYATLLGTGILVFAVISYFVYSPYRNVKKKVRDARNHIGDIEKIARREVRKNEKTRFKQAKKEQKQLQKEDRRQERRIRQENQKRPLKNWRGSLSVYKNKISDGFRSEPRQEEAVFREEAAGADAENTDENKAGTEAD